MSEAHYTNDRIFFDRMETENVEVYVCKFCGDKFELIDGYEEKVRRTYYTGSDEVYEEFNENHDYICETCKNYEE